MENIEIKIGDITKEDVDAIVNAANTSLLGGGGVDGAIHKAAGPGLLEECKVLGGCKTGQAKITKGYNLKACFVIHTPGPVWNGGGYNEDELLISSYKSCLSCALQYKVKSIAFPSISTGVYRFPVERASLIAIKTVLQFLSKNASLEKVIFVCFDRKTYDTYVKNYSDYIKKD